MTPTFIQCPCCSGSGRCALPPVLEATLAVIPVSGWTSTLEIVKLLGNPDGLGTTAFNNRLTTLKRLGLLKCERRGKALFWSQKVSKRKAA